MNGKQLGLLIVLLVVLGGAGLLVQHARNNSSNTAEQGAGGKLLGDDFPVNEVMRVSIKQGTNELNLVKTDIWRVRERSDYPASFPQITDFLVKAAGLKIIQTEQIGPSQLARLQLATGPETNSAIVLDLKDKNDKSLKTVTLGKMHTRKPPANSQFPDEGFPDGRYVLLAGATQNALLVADPLSTAEPKPEQWLNKDFFKVERPRAIAVIFPAATNSWKLTRDTETGEWKLADTKPGEQLDTNKISGVTGPFASPTLNDVLPLSAATNWDKPTVVTVDTFDDFTYTVVVGKKTNDDFPMTVTVAANFPKERVPAKDEKPEDKAKADKAWSDRQKQLDEKLKQTKALASWAYLVPAWNVDPVLKERKDLMVEKKEEKPADKTASTNGKTDEAKPADNTAAATAESK
jgi:hypothetical protein